MLNCLKNLTAVFRGPVTTPAGVPKNPPLPHQVANAASKYLTVRNFGLDCGVWTAGVTSFVAPFVDPFQLTAAETGLLNASFECSLWIQAAFTLSMLMDVCLQDDYSSKDGEKAFVFHGASRFAVTAMTAYNVALLLYLGLQ